MRYASYNVRRVFGPVWKWQADYRGEANAVGWSFSKAAARFAARRWIRSNGGNSAPEQGAPKRFP
jgi:hypothetical protein